MGTFKGDIIRIPTRLEKEVFRAVEGWRAQSEARLLAPNQDPARLGDDHCGFVSLDGRDVMEAGFSAVRCLNQICMEKRGAPLVRTESNREFVDSSIRNVLGVTRDIYMSPNNPYREITPLSPGNGHAGWIQRSVAEFLVTQFPELCGPPPSEPKTKKFPLSEPVMQDAKIPRFGCAKNFEKKPVGLLPLVVSFGVAVFHLAKVIVRGGIHGVRSLVTPIFLPLDQLENDIKNPNTKDI